MTNVHDNILGLIGNTPLVKLNTVTKDIPATVYAKLESYNPGHSTKDRIAVHIIEAAERKGLIKPDSTIVETTSGNTGFSIAMVCIIKGYKCILAVSNKTKKEKIAYLKALGATVTSALRMLRLMIPGLITKLLKESLQKLLIQFTSTNISMNSILMHITKQPDPKFGNRPAEK